MQKKKLYVNGIERSVVTEGSDLLADVIRKSLRLTGTKVGCGKGQCGACNQQRGGDRRHAPAQGHRRGSPAVQ